MPSLFIKIFRYYLNKVSVETCQLLSTPGYYQPSAGGGSWHPGQPVPSLPPPRCCLPHSLLLPATPLPGGPRSTTHTSALRPVFVTWAVVAGDNFKARWFIWPSSPCSNAFLLNLRFAASTPKQLCNCILRAINTSIPCNEGLMHEVPQTCPSSTPSLLVPSLLKAKDILWNRCMPFWSGLLCRWKQAKLQQQDWQQQEKITTGFFHSHHGWADG